MQVNKSEKVIIIEKDCNNDDIFEKSFDIKPNVKQSQPDASMLTKINAKIKNIKSKNTSSRNV